MTDHEPVRGPMYVTSTPLLVTVDVTPLVENNVHEVLELLATDDLFETFMELACAEPTGHDGHAPDRLAFEELKTTLVARLSTRVALTGMQALRVAEQMQTLGKARALPSQQQGGAA
jgi:hypothetical protein